MATQSTQAACLAAGIGLIDRTGTLLIRAPWLFIHVQGTTRVRRTSRVQPFGSTGARIVRLLLAQPSNDWTAQEVAAASDASHVFCHGVLSALEGEGFLRRRSPRSGFRLHNGAGLLKRWAEVGAPTTLVFERFNAPSTELQVLHDAAQALTAQGIRSIFTLASALHPAEVFASALPHALYISGDFTPAIDSLRLRPITPYNFLLLRPHPAADTQAGGIYCAPRALPQGPGVFLPQLVIDFQGAGGRGPEQANALLEQYANTLPLAEDPT